MNAKQRYAIDKKNKEKLCKLFPTIGEFSGIYILTRAENGISYAYVGQAKNILSRMSQHMMGYQHIDISLKKHGLWAEQNPEGWFIEWDEFPVEQLDEMERLYILKYAKYFQMYNHTLGGQGQGKSELGEHQRKGYRQGVEYGYNKALKEIKHLFDLHLNVSVKKEGNKTQLKALQKFMEMMEE